MNNPRIAWLLTSAFYYWHPTLSHLAKLFPQMTAFAPNWRGYALGFEDSFAVEVVGKRKIVSLKKVATGYGSSFTFLPLNIVSRLLRFKPDVIFSNSFGVWTILALLFKPVGKWRVVIAYEGSSPSVDYRNSPRRLSIRRAMVRAADACITNSCAGKAYLIDILNAAKNKVFVKPYEVPSAIALSEPCEAIESGKFQLKRPVFLFVGSLIPRKGLHLLMEACALLDKQGYHDYTLLVVGDGLQRQELEEFCDRHALTNCVRWAGRVDYSCLGAYFRQADVFVLPTLEDTWGVVVLEAMVLGKPVLCSQLAGAAEMVIDGENGYRFDPYDVNKLAEIMSQFIRNPSLADSMGHKSQELMTPYSPEAAAQFLAEVTNFVLKD
ncbi:MAG: glycosyltransferase family 4 protein [Aphanothece sp. CMT-3BRIN-NPC111]|jgi:glycosyltransferase involved in cell wall biosynthesis|nr:glycosyltransferase family 4 protein [Aphanothece sp. CMT-3BRIN-NPC111]